MRGRNCASRAAAGETRVGYLFPSAQAGAITNGPVMATARAGPLAVPKRERLSMSPSLSHPAPKRVAAMRCPTTPHRPQRAAFGSGGALRDGRACWLAPAHSLPRLCHSVKLCSYRPPSRANYGGMSATLTDRHSVRRRTGRRIAPSPQRQRGRVAVSCRPVSPRARKPAPASSD